MAAGARFDLARTVEPLTVPALASMLTGLYPHEHGATRNGIRIRAELDSLPRSLAARGYRTAAVIGSWPLRDRLSGLRSHFDDYFEVLNRKRWFGLLRGESTAAEVNSVALSWLTKRGRRPFFLWAHYAEPHAPYLLHRQYLSRLGVARSGQATQSDRYDTEIASVDAAVGDVLAWLDGRPDLGDRTLVVFGADHGESLGEHGEWGHGRTLYDTTLRIPLSLTWPGRIAPRQIETPATILDLPRTVLGLLDLPAPEAMRGYDWSGVLVGREPVPSTRVTLHQAHRGAVTTWAEPAAARRDGLLAVGKVEGRHKEVLKTTSGESWSYDLSTDPAEDAAEANDEPSADLLAWRGAIERELVESEGLEAELDAESIVRLKALGYLD